MADPKVNVLVELVDRVTKPLNGIQQSMSTAAKAIGAAFAGIALGEFFKSAVEEGIKAESGMMRLKTAVENAGGAFRSFSPRAEEAVKAVMRLSTATDDDLRDALTRMVTISGDAEGSLQNLQVVADLAAFKHISLGEAADVVAKAMTGNTTALKKMGIEAEGSTSAIDALKQKVGGFAQDEAQSFGGALQQIVNWWGEFKESIGTAIMSSDDGRQALGRVRDTLIDLARWVEKNQDAIGGFVSGLVTFAEFLGSVFRPVIGAAVGLWQDLENNARAFWYTIDNVGPAARRMTGAVLQALGNLLAGAKPVLKVLGLGDLPDQMKANGARMVAQADEDTKELRAIYFKHTDAVAKDAKDGQDTITRHHRQGKEARVELSKEQKDQLIALARLQKDAVVSITDEAVARIISTQQHMHDAIKPTGDALKDAIAKANKEWDAYQAKVADTAKDHKDKLVHMVENVSMLANGVLNTIDAIGGLDGAMKDALRSSIDLGTSIVKIIGATTNGDVIAGVTGAIGALGSLAKGLIGGNNALRIQVERNAERLRELRDTMGDLIDIQSPGRVVNQVAGLDNGGAISGFAKNYNDSNAGVTDKLIRDFLRKSGMSLKDLDQLADDFGIKIKDEKGRYIPAAILQLIEASKNADTAAPDTFRDQRRRIDTGVQIGAITDPIGEAVKVVTSGTIGSPALKAALAGIDLTTDDGRARAVANLRALYNKATKGQLKPSDFGGMSESDFLDAISWLIDMLTSAGVSASGLGGSVDTGDQPDSGASGGDVTPSFATGDAGAGVPSGAVDFGSTIPGADWADVKRIREIMEAGAVAGVAAGGITLNVYANDAVEGAAAGKAAVEYINTNLANTLLAQQARNGSAVRT